jgi:undecaprenyl diphosphate synthase
MLFKKKKEILTDERLDSVAIITDGNGRWAKRRNLPRTAGHIEGAKKIQPILEYFAKIGVHTVTFYAFSTENWKRPKEEVDCLMKIIYKYLDEVVSVKIRENKNFSVKFLGDVSILPSPLAEKCVEIENMAQNTEFVCNIALNYGGRDEIVHAANEAHRAAHEVLTEEILSKYMYTAPTPDPDLVIRTGGDFRISNFLLWQSAYSEYIVLDKFWPDITESDIDACVEEFYSRSRRFGGLENKNEK